MKKLFVGLFAILLLLSACSAETSKEPVKKDKFAHLSENNPESFNTMVKAKEEGRTLTQDELETIYADVSKLRYKYRTPYHQWVEQMFYNFNNDLQFEQAKQKAEENKDSKSFGEIEKSKNNG